MVCHEISPTPSFSMASVKSIFQFRFTPMRDLDMGSSFSLIGNVNSVLFLAHKIMSLVHGILLCRQSSVNFRH